MSATEPELFEINPADLWWTLPEPKDPPPESEDFLPDYWNATAAVLRIFEDTCEVCEMQWSGVGIQRLVDAFNESCLVQLGVHLPSREQLYFTAYIDGRMETQGVGFGIEPSMRRAWSR